MLIFLYKRERFANWVGRMVNVQIAQEMVENQNGNFAKLSKHGALAVMEYAGFRI